jgi:peroxiredoxin
VAHRRRCSNARRRRQANDTARHCSAFAFTFPDVDGKPVSLSDERFRGKVVLVTLGGTWCPNCHDEAQFLLPFYREHRDQGFEIIALMFERHGDFATAARPCATIASDLRSISHADRGAVRD